MTESTPGKPAEPFEVGEEEVDHGEPMPGQASSSPKEGLVEDVAPRPQSNVIRRLGPPRKTHPDDTRKWLANALVALLAVVVLTACYGWIWGDKTTDDLQGFALVLSPIVTLVGTVLGFYFSGALDRSTK